jgi:hypothetical protein
MLLRRQGTQICIDAKKFLILGSSGALGQEALLQLKFARTICNQNNQLVLCIPKFFAGHFGFADERNFQMKYSAVEEKKMYKLLKNV